MIGTVKIGHYNSKHIFMDFTVEEDYQNIYFSWVNNAGKNEGNPRFPNRNLNKTQLIIHDKVDNSHLPRTNGHNSQVDKGSMLNQNNHANKSTILDQNRQNAKGKQKNKAVNRQRIQNGIRANLGKKNTMKWVARPSSNKDLMQKVHQANEEPNSDKSNMMNNDTKGVENVLGNVVQQLQIWDFDRIEEHDLALQAKGINLEVQLNIPASMYNFDLQHNEQNIGSPDRMPMEERDSSDYDSSPGEIQLSESEDNQDDDLYKECNSFDEEELIKAFTPKTSWQSQIEDAITQRKQELVQTGNLSPRRSRDNKGNISQMMAKPGPTTRAKVKASKKEGISHNLND
ncbi:hypothetical protein K7X08_026628 [Anisodus acutangulus]|uniref:Uncharacterized protein n=1 Tax=Anisodus acutangulus TaxID=402998 RepID=A0A9Q1LC62_9SOLA|nr:hypothetical protein K7X08_026628 [Anisodus acutangulus]